MAKKYNFNTFVTKYLLITCARVKLINVKRLVSFVIILPIIYYICSVIFIFNLILYVMEKKEFYDCLKKLHDDLHDLLLCIGVLPESTLYGFLLSAESALDLTLISA